MLSPVVHRELNKYCKSVVNNAKRRLRTKPLPSSSELINSIDYTIGQDGDISFEYAQHGDYVEYGRRAGARMPPIAPIAKWCKRRGIRISPWAIAKSISKKGIRPYHWQDAFPSEEKPNSRASIELAMLWEMLIEMQLEWDLKELE